MTSVLIILVLIVWGLVSGAHNESPPANGPWWTED